MSGIIIGSANGNAHTIDPDKGWLDAIPNPPDHIIARVAAAMTVGANLNLSTWDVALRAIKAQQKAMADLGFEMSIMPKRIVAISGTPTSETPEIDEIATELADITTEYVGGSETGKLELRDLFAELIRRRFEDVT